MANPEPIRTKVELALHDGPVDVYVQVYSLNAVVAINGADLINEWLKTLRCVEKLGTLVSLSDLGGHWIDPLDAS